MDLELDSVRFRQARPGAEGYDVAQVDAFVAELREALRSTPPRMAPWEVRDKVFKVARMHRGYDEHEVDDFLDRAEAQLREAQGVDLDEPSATGSKGRLSPAVWLLVLLSVLMLVVAVVRWPF